MRPVVGPRRVLRTGDRDHRGVRRLHARCARCHVLCARRDDDRRRTVTGWRAPSAGVARRPRHHGPRSVLRAMDEPGRRPRSRGDRRHDLHGPVTIDGPLSPRCPSDVAHDRSGRRAPRERGRRADSELRRPVCRPTVGVVPAGPADRCTPPGVLLRWPRGCLRSTERQLLRHHGHPGALRQPPEHRP